MKSQLATQVPPFPLSFLGIRATFLFSLLRIVHICTTTTQVYSRGRTERIVRVLVYGLVLDVRRVGFGLEMGKTPNGQEQEQMIN